MSTGNSSTTNSTNSSSHNRLPPNYFSDLLAEALSSVNSSAFPIPGTNIFQVEDEAISDSPIRIGHITAMLPLSRSDKAFNMLLLRSGVDKGEEDRQKGEGLPCLQKQERQTAV